MITVRLGVAAAAAACALTLTDAAAQSPLRGSWKLDPRRSSLSGAMLEHQAVIQQVMTIEQDGNRLSVSTRTTGGPLGDVWDNTIFFLDGREHPLMAPGRTNGPAAGTRTARWLGSGSGLDVEEQVSRTVNGVPVVLRRRHHWTLSPDGMTLTVESVTQGRPEEVRIRRVFRRQSPGSRA